MKFKFKIKKSFSKRFILKFNGNYKALHSSKSHLLTKKKSDIKRRLRTRLIFKKFNFKFYKKVY